MFFVAIFMIINSCFQTRRASHHPNIAAFVGVTSDPADISAQCLIITEYYQNGSLHDYLQKNQNISWRKCVVMLQGIAAALVHLHAQQILHCDLHLRNVLMDNDNHSVRVTDLGLAKLLPDGEDHIVHMSLVLWNVTAPEALNGYWCKGADIYSFGTLIWQLCHRGMKYPYEHILRHDVLASQREDHVSAEEQLRYFIVRHRLNTGLPLGISYPLFLQQLMVDCWQPNPVDRPTAQQLLTRFQNWLRASVGVGEDALAMVPPADAVWDDLSTVFYGYDPSA